MLRAATVSCTRALIIDLRTCPLNVDGALTALAGQSLKTEPYKGRVILLVDEATL